MYKQGRFTRSRYTVALSSSMSVREEVPQRNLSSSRKVMSDRCSNFSSLPGRCARSSTVTHSRCLPSSISPQPER
ncbi:unnamed protein product [Sphagnum troendelagicum]|uniref:Uncharacterized protein n=1 Tax=Sphagnum troendelagicum TaxID=128251 RepID=A0ABP0UMC0_9BRYO